MSSLQIGGNDTPGQVVAKTRLARQWLEVDEPSGPAPEVVLRVSAHIPEASPAVQDVFLPAFRRLAHMSNGAIGVRSTWGGALHAEHAGIQALRQDLTDLCPVYSAWDPRMFPAAQALSLPFLFGSAEAATHVSERLYRRHFARDLEAQGILMGRMVATSEYNLFSRQPIACLEDLQGQRVACSDGLEAQLFAALGAEPVGCSTPEAKQRFAQKDVAAVSISDSAAFTVGLFRDAAYRTQANLARVNLEYGLSPHFFGRLPAPLRPVLNRWLRGLAQAGAQLFYGLAGAQARQAFAEAGLVSLALDARETERWRARLAPVQAGLRDELIAAGLPAEALLRDLQHEAEACAGWSCDQFMAHALEHPFEDLLPADAVRLAEGAV